VTDPRQLAEKLRPWIAYVDHPRPQDARDVLDELVARAVRADELEAKLERAESALTFYAEYGQDAGAWARNYFSDKTR
jgi:hypothetical protein